jgi:broad specificity phosphatase PhoE
MQRPSRDVAVELWAAAAVFISCGGVLRVLLRHLMGHDDWRPAAILIGVGVLAAAAAGAMQLLATRDD